MVVVCLCKLLILCNLVPQSKLYLELILLHPCPKVLKFSYHCLLLENPLYIYCLGGCGFSPYGVAVRGGTQNH